MEVAPDAAGADALVVGEAGTIAGEVCVPGVSVGDVVDGEAAEVGTVGLGVAGALRRTISCARAVIAPCTSGYAVSPGHSVSETSRCPEIGAVRTRVPRGHRFDPRLTNETSRAKTSTPSRTASQARSDAIASCAAGVGGTRV